MGAKAQSEKRTLYLRDTELTGFGVVSTKTGTCSYFIEYRLGGRAAPQKRVKLAKHGVLTPDEARNRAKAELGKVANGVDVGQAKKKRREGFAEKRAAGTLKEAIKRFLEVHAKPTRYWLEKGQRLLGNDLKSLHGKLIREIADTDLQEMFDNVKKRNASAHRLLFADLRPFWKWAKKRYKLAVNPMAEAEAPAAAKRRERTLEPHEIKAVWQACAEWENANPKKHWPFCIAWKLLMLTGCRLEEVTAMHWGELDLEAKVWTLPAREDFTFERKRRDGTVLVQGRTKNTREHKVPLLDTALALLDRAAIEKLKSEKGYALGSDMVFSTTGTTPPSGDSKAKKALDLRMVEILGGKVDWDKEKIVAPGRFKPWRQHDLRRTVATVMEDLEIDTRVIDAALNHVSGSKAGITGTYQTSKHREKRKLAFLAWERYLLEIVGDDAPVSGASNVLLFTPRVA